MLSRQKSPVLGAMVVIGVGLGLAAMVFALADAYVWKPLPYADPDRLVSISFDRLSGPPGEWNSVTQADIPSLANWQARTDLFEDVAAFDDQGWLRIQLAGRVVPLRAVAVTDNLLEVLGLQPRWAESDPAAAWVSTRVATTLSGGEIQPGRSVRLLPEGVLRVRTVLSRSFLLPEPDRTLPVDVLTVLPPGPVMTKEGASTSAPGLVARTRPGITPTILEAALSATMPAGRHVSVVPLAAALTARLRGLALGALLASGLIVLVCWTNVFSIALTRGLYRGPEIATRTALGATRGRIVRLLAVEGAKVAAWGCVSALAVVWLVLSAAVLVLPPQFATLGMPSVTTRVAIFVFMAGAVAGMSWCIASILAWQLGMRRQSRQVAGRDGRAIRIVRFALVAGQLGAASVLLAGAALLGRSYVNLLSIDIGMDDRTETLTVAHNPNLPQSLRREAIERTLLVLRRAEGVQAAGASFGGLLDGKTDRKPVRIDGRLTVPDWNLVAGDYFEAMGFEFLSGGPPGPDQPASAVINESLARQQFGGRMPVGEVIFPYSGTAFPIVGVVQDVRSRALSLTPMPAVYEVSDDWGRGSEPRTTYVLRVAGTSPEGARWVRAVQERDPLAVVLDSGTIGERLGRSILDRTFATLVVGLFAVASIVVIALGLAGIVAYTVVKRTREIAVRLALGATGRSVTRLVVREAVLAGACGVAGGVTASAWLSSTLESLLYGIRPADPITLLLSAASLLGIVLIAAILPAIRAARIAPATALRTE